MIVSRKITMIFVVLTWLFVMRHAGDEFTRLPQTSVLQETLLPTKVDMSSDMPPVQNQGGQTSCVAFAVGYYYKSYQERKEHGWDYSEETVFSPSYIYNQIAKNNKSTLYFETALKMLKEQGIAPYSTFKTDTNDWQTKPSDAQREIAAEYKAASYSRIERKSGMQFLKDIKEHLARVGPVAFGFPIPAYGLVVRGWGPEIILRTPTVIDVPDATQLHRWVAEYNHAVLLVGYDDTSQRFKFVNSWGTGWGEKGYGFITYQFVVEVSDNVEAWTMVDHTAPKPTLRLISVPDFPRLMPGEVGKVSISVQNTGPVDWPDDGTVLFTRLSGATLDIPSPLQLSDPIPVGAILEFTLPVQAPQQAGVYDSVWRFSYEKTVFGSDIPITVIVLPKGSDAGFSEMIAALIERERQRLAASFETAWDNLKAEIERQIRAEIQRQVSQMIQGLCGAAPTGLVFTGGIIWWRRQRRRWL